MHSVKLVIRLYHCISPHKPSNLPNFIMQIWKKKVHKAQIYTGLLWIIKNVPLVWTINCFLKIQYISTKLHNWFNTFLLPSCIVNVISQKLLKWKIFAIPDVIIRRGALNLYIYSRFKENNSISLEICFRHWI